MHYGDKHNDISYNGILVPAAAEYGICALTGDGVDPEVMKMPPRTWQRSAESASRR